MAEATPTKVSVQSAVTAQWHMGHAVTAPSLCCTAYRRRYVVYAATPNAVAVVDVAAGGTASTSINDSAGGSRSPAALLEARWRGQMRVCPLAAPAETISFVCGHPERDVLCVGTAQSGLYLTSLSNPLFAESTKLPRSVTGDATFGATFLFTEEANYLAFSSLLLRRAADATPYRLSLWDVEAAALLWRGAMAPLSSMCSFPYDLSFAACNGGRISLFTVQSSGAAEAAASTPQAEGSGGGGDRRPHGERARLVVLSRHCSTVDELSGATYACCLASPAEGEESYLALTTHGFLVAFHASSGSVVRWMDCKVPRATALSVLGGESLVLTGELTRLFHSGSWEFQGKIKSEPALPLTPPPHSGSEEEEGSSSADVFTGAVGAGGDGDVLLLLSASGALSFYSVEAKAAGTHRLSLHRSLHYTPLNALGDQAEWLPLSSGLWCWWTPKSLLFLSAPGAALVAAFAVPSSCVCLHPASATVVVFDTQRRALVAYGRSSTSSPAPAVAEVGSAACAADPEEDIVSLASSQSGESIYALVQLPRSALPPRLRRYRCGWGSGKRAESARDGFYIDCMKLPDGQGSGGQTVAASAATATTVSLPAGTVSLLVHASGSAAEGGDRVAAVLPNAVVSVGLSGHRERAAAPTYAHSGGSVDRVLPCQGGVLVLSKGGAGAAATLVQWRGTTAFRWAAKPVWQEKAKEAARRGGAEGGTAGSRRVVAAVAGHRSDVVALCFDSTLMLWLMTETPRLVASCALYNAAVSHIGVEVEEAAGLARVWTAGAAGVDAYSMALPDLKAMRGAVAGRGAAGSSSVSSTPSQLLSPPPTAASSALRKSDVTTPSEPKPKAAHRSRTPPLPPQRPAKTAAAAPPLSMPTPSQSAAATTSDAASRPTARTPRVLPHTAATHLLSLADARRQRRTASAGAPSSRQLSERFDELTGFYARQKREHDGNDHPRTPRAAGTAGRAERPHPSPEPPAVSGTPAEAEGGGVTASAVVVSAMTIDSQVWRGATAPLRSGEADGEGEGEAEPLRWSDSPPLRADARRGAALRTPPPAAAAATEDAVLHGSATSHSPSLGTSATPDREPQRDVPQPTRPPQLHLRGAAAASAHADPTPRNDNNKEEVEVGECNGSLENSAESHRRTTGDGGDGSSVVSEDFTVHARQLRESLLHIKELLEQSEMAESRSVASLRGSATAVTDETDLDELASLLTTVAAQLHHRQVRRSAETA